MQHLRSASRSITQVYEAELLALDLTAGQFSTLVALGRQQGVTVSVLAGRIGMDRTTMTRALVPLERRELIRITPSPNDMRAKSVYLEEKGQALLAEAIPIWEAAQARVIKKIGAQGWEMMRQGLSKLSK